MRRAALIGLVACGGAPPKPPVVPEVAPMVRPAPALEPALPAYGARDAKGQADGEWLFDCDGVAQGCRAWYEHGAQVLWGRTVGTDRYLIEALDGGWRWQWWSGNVLRGQAGLAFEPPRWTPGEIVAFPGYAAPPQGSGCAGPFVLRDPNGAVVSDGTCENAQWTEWNSYDALGHKIAINRRDGDSSDSQSLDADGRVLSRVQIASGTETDEVWSPDGTPQSRLVRTGTAVLENRTWYADGTPAQVDVTTGRDRVDRRYAPTGVLVAEATYRDGMPRGTWRTWYATGAKRSSVKYRADGSAGPLTLWQRSGKKVATANLAARTWSDGSHHGTRVAAVRVADGDDRVGIDGMNDCRATDKKCVRTLVAVVFSPLGCVYPTPDDPLSIWRGRIELTLGFDRTGVAGVTAVRDGDGLPPAVLDCFTGSFGAPGHVFQQHVDLVLDVDTLTEPSPPPPMLPKPDIPDAGDPMF